MKKHSLRLMSLGSFVLLTLGALMLLPSQIAQDTLRSQAHEQSETQQPCSINWSSLAQINADLRAWIQIEGCSVDCPVVCLKPDDPDFYLEHDFWQHPSIFGCPFLSEDTDPNGACMLVYGHHINWSNESFSELFDCWKPERFAMLGSCTWITERVCEEELVPLCSLLTDHWDQEVQEIAMGSPAKLRTSLLKLCQRARARSNNWEQLCSSATRVLKLVTCASAIPGQEARTCIVFVGSRE